MRIPQLLLLVPLLIAGCKASTTKPEHDEHEDHVQTEQIRLSPEAEQIAGIETDIVRRQLVQEQIKVPGLVTTTTEGRAVVTPPVAGQVLELLVSPGKVVRAGQPIARLRSSELAEAAARVTEASRDVLAAQSDLKESAAEVALAQNKAATAAQLLARQKAFAKTGAFSQPTLQAAQKELADAEAELDRGKQDQNVHEAQLERAERLYAQELISRTELEQARLEVATDKIRQKNAERRIDLAKSTFQREQRIVDQGLTNSRELQSADAELRAAKLEIERARIRHRSASSAVVSARKGLLAANMTYGALAGTGGASGGTLTVRAPISGVIVDVSATLGQAVERTSELCEIENLQSVLVVAQVPDKQIGLVQPGMTSHVQINGLEPSVFSGIVQSIGTRLDSKTRTLPVQVLVDNGHGKLRNGMVATVLLGVGTKSSALVVPRSAVVEDGDLRKVFVQKSPRTYEEQVVELGKVQGTEVEIVSGLEEGDTVVTKGAFVLKSEKVKSELKGHDH